MDDSACQHYFREPAGGQHRQYEALRAVFFDHQPIAEVADRYGYQYGTLRNLLSRFRRQLAAGSPPFSMEPQSSAHRRSTAKSFNPTLQTSACCR